MAMRLWQAQANIDARLDLVNAAGDCTGWWHLERLSPASNPTVIDHQPQAGDPVSSGVIQITYDPRWANSVQTFQWIIIAVSQSGAAITAEETLSQGGADLAASDGFGTALAGPPVAITPALVSNNKTACPFQVQYP
jgi:hypothetical protein